MGENPNWVPPLEYILEKGSPLSEIETWCNQVYGSGRFKIYNMDSTIFCRIYVSDPTRRIQFRLRWAEYINRVYEAW